MAFCMYCGAQIQDGSQFCSACGKKQVKVYTQTFTRGNMSEDQFIQQINQWFATYPHVANVKGKFMLNHGFGFAVNKYVIDAFSIEYELFKGENENQYAVVMLQNTGIVKTTTDTLLARWKEANPGAVVISRDGGVNQRGSAGSLALGGFGATNKTQLYVFFKFKRDNGTAK